MDPASSPLWYDVGISSSGGVPTLMINGTPRFAWSVHRPYPGHYFKPDTWLAACGLNLFQIDATCSDDSYFRDRSLGVNHSWMHSAKQKPTRQACVPRRVS